MIQEERIQPLNRYNISNGDYVLYWMQASQRAEYNHALEFAIRQANELSKPLIVYFGLTDNYPEANERHYYFMLQGLKEIQTALRDRRIQMVIKHCSPEQGAIELSKRASLVVCDCGYLKLQLIWRRQVAEKISCPLIQVESDVVVPIEKVSDKEEYSAATIRRKLHPLLPKYLVNLEERDAHIDSMFEIESYNISEPTKALDGLMIDRSVNHVQGIQGGTFAAKEKLREFIESKLDVYEKLRNDPNSDSTSGLSPYLHFGQISPLYIALRVGERGGAGVEAFLEELIIRRELSMNFVHYNWSYDSYDGLPGWSKRTLVDHKIDHREYKYTLKELENARTHDPYWNAAQQEMVLTGKMHGYMRMYWGKKMIEWTSDPEEAYKIALYLNNKYELDGRDPNSFAGIAWCFGKHDRPWAGRPIFGNVRYMSASGLERKFDIEKYVEKYQTQG